VRGLPLHTLVRGAFVMRDRQLVAARRGHGVSVHRIQQMPVPVIPRPDQAIAACVLAPV